MFVMNDQSDRAPWFDLCVGLVERALSSFERAPLVFISLSFVFYLPVLVFSLVWPVFGPSAAGFMGSALAWGLSSLLYAGAVVMTAAGSTKVVGMVRNGQRPTVGQAFGAMSGAAPALLATVLVGGALEFVGWLVIVPGIVVSFWLVFAGPAAMDEGLKGWPAVQRGRTLVGEGRWIQVAIIGIMVVVLRVGLSMLPDVAVNVYMMLMHNRSDIVVWLMTAWVYLVDVVLISIASAWIGAAWFDTTEALHAEELRAAEARRAAQARTAEMARAKKGPRSAR